jgi:hypothetical protein
MELLDMANPLSENLVKGTIGELIVQIRLLQYGVQAAPPIKDSGNDLVALKGYSIKTIQVKTCSGQFRTPFELPEKYHLLALVRLCGFDIELQLDQTDVYLVPKEHVTRSLRVNCASEIEKFKLSKEHVDALFAEHEIANETQTTNADSTDQVPHACP